MQQVADRASVSISTVSFVVNNTKPVTPETRDRVLRAISELGYRRNTAARALASRKSRILALIYPLLDHRNHHAFVEAAATAAEEHGYNLVLWPLHSDNVTTEITSLIQAGFADGVLLMEVQFDDERVTRLHEAEAPFALIGRTRDLDGIDYVDIDFERTTETAVADLAELGHRDFSLVLEDLSDTPLAGYAPPFRAEETFRRVISERGLKGAVFRVPHRARAISSVADEILRDAPNTTAIIAMHDEAALSLVNALPHRGIAIPQDISVVALATATTLADVTDPPLSTYVAPGHELGRKAAEILIARLEGRGAPAGQALITCLPHKGGTVAPARAPATSPTAP
ncbi:LacI family DNA-binding transcriptional regulator [Gryllotalpicola reticulitermitis]|uniref:LacI family DNA-binding transcriptional regulator n=1 Tax=Gryllotalpicola reticulitermitis TaxID=1184153 RepID=A0ABV8Q5N2_9MICO